MSKFTVAMKRFGGFMKRNAVYFLIVLCIASVAAVIALAVTRDTTMPDIDASIGDDNQPTVNPGNDPSDQPDNPDNPNDPTVNPNTPVEETLKFCAPCNDGEVSKSYDDATLVWNATLKQFSTHLALDFKAEDLNVYAAADGTIKEIGYNALDGNYVEITHKDGYTSRYLSLAEPCTLKLGASIKQGQLLGQMSTTQGSESLDGAHLHFEILKDGECINPLDVMISSEK